MEKVEILKAPKPVRGFKRITSNIHNYSKKHNSKDRSKIFVPQQSQSFRQLPHQNPYFTNSLFSQNDCEEDLTKEFEELSVKDEIISILRNDSTFCDSPFFKNHERISFLLKDNIFEHIELDLDNSLELENTSNK